MSGANRPTHSMGLFEAYKNSSKDFSPEHIVAVFDGPNNKQSRVEIYEEYKSHREGMPEDLGHQLELTYDYCNYAGIPTLTIDGYEADDAMGAVAKWAEEQGAKSFLCSSDKDLSQLVNDQTVILNTHKNNLIIDKKKVEELYGVTPEQFIDYLAIVGDSSDNIPGIAGFGPKTAAELLRKEKTLTAVLDNPECVKGPKKQETLANSHDVALMSKQLATIITHLDIPKEPSFYSLKEPDTDNLRALYKEMNFASLLKEEAQKPRPAPTYVEEPVTYHLVDDEESLDALVKRLYIAKEVCIDTESSQLQPLRAQLVGIGFCIEPKEAWYVPANGNLGLDYVVKTLRPLLKQLKCYGHNIKYDLHILANHDLEVPHVTFDTMVASYLIAPSGKHSLDHLSLDLFGKVKTPIKELIGSGKNECSMLEVDIERVATYCCEDVDYTARLKHFFQKELLKNDLMRLFDKIEIPLIPVLMRMERNGMYVDPDRFVTMSKELTEQLRHLEKAIYQDAGREFNIKSPKQLGEVLFEELKLKPRSKKHSTAAAVLESIQNDHPIVKKVLQFRVLEKLRSTYVDALPHQINPQTGRIHCNFIQTGTATGRLACQDPNLQNIPIRSKEGRTIREAFIPEHEGSSFLSADYSQIELRLLAHFSEDPMLIKAFTSGEDIHTSTASLVFDTPLDQVTQEMRFRAKAVNFGIIYGQGAYGLAGQLGIPPKEARDFITAYFETYPKVKQFLSHCKEIVRHKGYATTIAGRQRPIPEINSPNGMIRSAAERLAVNTPLQGSQADIIKMAMIKIDKKLGELGIMVLQIHDELVFEVPDPHLLKLKTLVTEVMEGIITLKVPLTVDVEVGKNWSSC